MQLLTSKCEEELTRKSQAIYYARTDFALCSFTSAAGLHGGDICVQETSPNQIIPQGAAEQYP